MGQQTTAARTSIGEQLAVTARIYEQHPQHVEAIAALAAVHAEQAIADGRPDSYDAGIAAFDRAMRALLRDPRLDEIKARLVADYVPPPYTQPLKLPGEIEAHGEPITVSVGVGAAAIAAAALLGGLIGASIPL